jgi:hypothetical protein
MTATDGRIVVVQQPDGWWRWRFEPATPDTGPLVSGEAYPDREEALSSAGSAYPQVRLDVEDPPRRQHRLGRFVRRLGIGVLVAVVVAAAARSGNRRA